MAFTSKSIEINCTKNKVQEFLFNLNNIPFWQQEIKRVEWKTSPPANAGTEIALVSKFFGNKIKDYFVILELTDHTLVMKKYDAFTTVEITLRIESINEETTKVTIEYCLGENFFTKQFKKCFSFFLKRTISVQLKKIKKRLERIDI